MATTTVAISTFSWSRTVESRNGNLLFSKPNNLTRSNTTTRLFGSCKLVSHPREILAPKISKFRPSFVADSDYNEAESTSESEPDIPCKETTIDLQLPRRRLLVQFTCNACGERTGRYINRLAYERGMVFVQCAGCLKHHKLVDNLGLVVEYNLLEDTNTQLND